MRDRFRESVRVDEFVEPFGREEPANGMLVRDLIAILPDQGVYGSLDEMTEDVRTSDSGRTATINAFGLDVDVATVRDAPVERYTDIPAAARTAMVSAGILTVSDLSSANPGQLLEIPQSQGVAAGLGDTAEWTAGAKALGFASGP